MRVDDALDDAADEVIKAIKVSGIVSKSAVNQEWACLGCDFWSTEVGDARKHYGRDHVVVRWVRCDQCNLRCGPGGDLREHKRQHHPG